MLKKDNDVALIIDGKVNSQDFLLRSGISISSFSLSTILDGKVKLLLQNNLYSETTQGK